MNRPEVGGVRVADVGFTGTRDGCTDEQLQRVAMLLSGRRGATFRHGDCVGADDQCAYLAYVAGLYVVGHPPDNEDKRAYNRWTAAWCKPEPYLVRNRGIVDLSDWLVAVPNGEEVMRSGTWATVRYARQVGRPVVIVYPDGTVDRTVAVNTAGEV